MLDDLKRLFQGNNFVGQIILINASVFLVFNLISFLILRGDESWSYSWFAIPSGLREFVLRPWSLFTYMFLHRDFGHILWNMLFLFWFGRIFQDFMGSQRLTGLYFLGGLAGAVLYLAIYTILFLGGEDYADKYTMVGASAAVMAVMVAVGTRFPDYVINLMLIGPVRLKYLVLFSFIVSTLLNFTANFGGNIAHIGGAAFGFMYARGLDRGKDWALDFYNFFSRIKLPSFGKKEPRIRVVHKDKSKARSRSKSSGEMTEAEKQSRLDLILDKISKTGYDNLSKEEKDFLFKMSDKH